MAATFKECNKCHDEKLLSKFWKNKSTKDGFHPRCKVCTKQDNKKSYINRIKKNPNYNGEKYKQASKNPGYKEKQRNSRYKRVYGITLKEYDVLFEMQKGLCAICGHPERDKRKLAVDHNHETGEIRGLLCVVCNTNLGWYEISKIKVDNYLER